MTLSMAKWHQRYLQQAHWTKNLRKYIYDHVGITRAKNILDIGCGTGVLGYELNRLTSAKVYGLDINPRTLDIAKEYSPNSIYSVGDCSHLPYQFGAFDVTLCHFLLLWVTDPLSAIEEMVRVTRPHGFVLALAEPDYGGRIDYPLELFQIGLWQMTALKEQGANPLMGRELRSIFTRAGLINIEVGVLGGQWGKHMTNLDLGLEWEVIQSDLEKNKDFIKQADHLKTIEQSSREAHHRILFVPTFYAIGMVRG